MVQRILNIPKILGSRASALLFGARGVGKTALSRSFIEQLREAGQPVMTYDLLHSETYERYLKEPHLLRLEVAGKIKPDGMLLVFIDEVQKVPPLLDEVHSLIETYKGNVRFLLSGSSARKLKRGGANLLAGRALTLHLHPLTSEEADMDLSRCLRLGSLPGIVFDNDAPELSLKSYVSTYLKEEIQQEAHVRRIDAFARFLEVAAQYHGEPINASTIAKSAGVSSQTISEYFGILEDTLLGWRLPGWSASTHKQLRTTPKFYFFDNGVANALRGELGITLTERSGRYGKLFEAWVIQEMIRYNDYHNLDLKFSYWRTNSDLEVDVIASRGAGAPIAAIEIKSATSPETKELVGLDRFQQDYPKAKRLCFCRTPKAFVHHSGVTCMPWQDGLKSLAEL